MQEVTTHISTFGILLIKKYWFMYKKSVILMIAVQFPSCVIHHVSLRLSKLFPNFHLLPGITILCTVTGKEINHRAGLEIEIPVMYHARGHEKALQ